MSAAPDDRRVLLEDEFLDAARTLRDIDARRKAFAKSTADEENAARELIAKVLAEGETGVDADGVELVQIRPGARVWNDDAARANLLPEMLEQISVTETVTRLDRTRAKDTLAPALYALCTKQNRASVVVL